MSSKKFAIITIVYLAIAVSGSLYGIGEKTIRLGGDSIWKMADYKTGITEMKQLRSQPVLVLSSAQNSGSGLSPDLALSFDEGKPSLFRDSAGNYRVSVSPSLGVVDNHYARIGSGAALFPDELPTDARPEKAKIYAPLTVEVQTNSALFAPKNRIFDFSIEFWLHPLNMENGEQILQWSSALPISGANYASQRILCVASKNRLQWTFSNFYISPDGLGSIDINLAGVTPVVPKTWSHHRIYFDSAAGMLEYLVNGKTEAIEYATSTGHESGEVYTPVAGEGGCFILGNSYSGLIDEFKIYGSHTPQSSGVQHTVRKYSPDGGRIETRAIDLGEGSNGIVKVEASGGRTSVVDTKINNEYRNNGIFRFSDDSEMQFFIRGSDNPYRWTGTWQPITPGAELTKTVYGRYVQLAVDFYPSANGESSPYLEELLITYQPDEAPLPPAQLTAVASDGMIQLRWKNSPDPNARGYLVYYGSSADDYFGEDASLGKSPIDVGKLTAVNINGLKNGTLYYFRVAAYSSPSHVGEFSREVRARPLVPVEVRR